MENKIENFQECSHLEIVSEFEKSKSNVERDTLGDLMNLQKTIQQDVYGYDFEEMQNNMKKMSEFWQWNMWALSDEMHEAMNALGGIKDGIGSGVWKPWKKSNKELPNMKLSDLSESDLKELKMEITDCAHFFLNLAISIGMTSQELYDYYFAKNKENIERQKRGY
jgi:NTP pyrophosphatase (non-canonical NTP hydrolase)